MIPQGWQEKTLGEICEFRNGLWTGKKEPFIECNVIRNANFSKDFKLNYDNVVRISVEEKQFNPRELKYGDLILEKSGGGPNQPVGRVVIFDKHENGYSFSNFTSLIRIKNKELINFRFLYLYLCYCYLSGMTIKMQKNSTGIRNLIFDEYKNIRAPIPNIKEQERIVAKLDKAFEAIDKAKTIAETNLKNVKELFDGYVNEIYTKLSLSEKQCQISDIAKIKGGKRVPKGYKLISEKTAYPYIRVADFDDYGSVDLSDIRYISEDIYQQIRNYTISAKDLYISIAGTIGKSGIIPNVLEGANLTENACKLVFSGNVYNKFVYYFTQTRYFIYETQTKTRTAAQPKLALSRLATIEIPMPDINIQYKIVNQLDKLQEQTKQLEAIYTKKIKDLDELKQSILNKAFKGEL